MIFRDRRRGARYNGDNSCQASCSRGGPPLARSAFEKKTPQSSFLPRVDRFRPRSAEPADTSNPHWRRRPRCDAAKHGPMRLRHSHHPGRCGERRPIPRAVRATRPGAMGRPPPEGYRSSDSQERQRPPYS